MSLYWIDQTATIRRNVYSGDKSTMGTVHTEVGVSVQRADGELEFTDTGYASSPYTVFTGNEHTIQLEDRLITSEGIVLRVLGVKTVTSGSEDFMQLECVEEVDA